MFSETQCRIVRLMTGTDTPDEIISEEYAAMLGPNRNVAAMRINQAVAKYNKPFDEAWDDLQIDFREIASQYNISSATLLCIYIEWNNANNKAPD